jgi:DNA-binding response OmpR family regulator
VTAKKTGNNENGVAGMILIVDERETVISGYEAGFEREGIASIGLSPQEFEGWVETAAESDVGAVEAFLLGDCQAREHYPRLIRRRSEAPVVVLNEAPGLEFTLKLFAAGADDVVRKPVHVREIMARIGAIRRRASSDNEGLAFGELKIFFDGRDPEIGSEPLQLPRRERRILEFLAANSHRRVSRAQIFNSIYGLFDERVEESVVESHISKLRKKLKHLLGHDPIDSKRYLGYQLMASTTRAAMPLGGLAELNSDRGQGRVPDLIGGEMERIPA